MSRYTGPAWKISRRLGYSILGTGEELAKRTTVPGQHGDARQKKKTEYGTQLTEKQKLRFTYGLSEKQFRRFFLIAKADKEKSTGLALFQLLESRLDNLVYRMGFAKTRRQARQLVNHGHILFAVGIYVLALVFGLDGQAAAHTEQTFGFQFIIYEPVANIGDGPLCMQLSLHSNFILNV